jgi:hypothetical protein
MAPTPKIPERSLNPVVDDMLKEMVERVPSTKEEEEGLLDDRKEAANAEGRTLKVCLTTAALLCVDLGPLQYSARMLNLLLVESA